MTLEQLRVFVAVAERQYVTRAAEALTLAQSAVSAAIAALEARHHAKLFYRVGRGIELTEAGSLFLVEAQAVLATRRRGSGGIEPRSSPRIGQKRSSSPMRCSNCRDGAKSMPRRPDAAPRAASPDSALPC
jgi:DNA-binding transcriptional LysR family regulator